MAARQGPQKNSSTGGAASGVEQGLDVRVAQFFLGELQQGEGAEAEGPGQQQVGELRDAEVVQVDRTVVELAAVGVAVLQIGSTRLEMLEGVVGLELRVVLRQGEQLAEARPQARLGPPQGVDVPGLPGAG